MAEKKAYPLRMSAQVLDAVQRWAGDDLRSLNAQIEFLLRRALQAEGQLKPAPPGQESRRGGSDPEK